MGFQVIRKILIISLSSSRDDNKFGGDRTNDQPIQAKYDFTLQQIHYTAVKDFISKTDMQYGGHYPVEYK